MTGTTSRKRNAAKLAGSILVAVLAAAPAMADQSISGDSFLPQGDPVAVAAMSFTGWLYLDGCAPSPKVTYGCKTRMTTKTGDLIDPCVMTVVSVISPDASASLCQVHNGSGSPGSATVKVTNNRCDRIAIWDLRDVNLKLTDAKGNLWNVTGMRILAGDHKREAGAVDAWKLDSSDVYYHSSYILAQRGTVKILMWLNGSIASTGSCEAGRGSTSFIVVAEGHGWEYR